MTKHIKEAMPFTSHDQGQRRLSFDDTGYRYSTVPGSGRIKLRFADGTPIAMWTADSDDPWALLLEGFRAFSNTGHAEALHRKLLEIDRRRRSR